MTLAATCVQIRKFSVGLYFTTVYSRRSWINSDYVNLKVIGV